MQFIAWVSLHVYRSVLIIATQEDAKCRIEVRAVQHRRIFRVSAPMPPPPHTPNDVFA